MKKGKLPLVTEMVMEDGQSSESIITSNNVCSSNSGPPPDQDDSSKIGGNAVEDDCSITSLKLGLPFS